MNGEAQVRSAQRPAEEKAQVKTSALHSVRFREYAIRFAFGFIVSVVAGIVTLLFGGVVGGLFLGFPAILPATLTLMERKQGIAHAASDARGATVGATGMLAFALVAYALVRHNAVLALTGALVAWILVSAIVYVAMRALTSLLGEKQYLPEIPTSEAADVINLARERGVTIAVAESCTGGIVGALLSQVPSSDQIFRGGVVAYQAGVKTKLLGLPPDLVAEKGAVTMAVSERMAAAVRAQVDSDFGIGITGATGAACDGVPAGTVHLAVAARQGVVLRQTLTGDEGPGRNTERAVRAALGCLVAAMKGEKGTLPQPL